MKKIFSLGFFLLWLFILAAACNNHTTLVSPTSSGAARAMDLVTSSPTPEQIILPLLPQETATALPTLTIFPGQNTFEVSDALDSGLVDITDLTFVNKSVQPAVNAADSPVVENLISGSGCSEPVFLISTSVLGLPNQAAGSGIFLCYFNLPSDVEDTSDVFYVGLDQQNSPVTIIANNRVVTSVYRTSTGCVEKFINGGLFHGGINTVGFAVSGSDPLVIVYEFGATLVSVTPTPTPSPNTTDTPTFTSTVSPTPTFTFTPTATPTCPGGNYSPSYAPYKQYTGGWQQYKMPIGNTTSGPNRLSSGALDPHTIKSDGCLMTCLSMIASGYDPGLADNIISANNHITLTGDLEYTKAAGDLGLSLDGSYPANNSNIPQALSESDFVIARVPHGGRTHYVFITGVTCNPATQNCDYTISDPGSAGVSFLSQYGPVDLLIEIDQ